MSWLGPLVCAVGVVVALSQGSLWIWFALLGVGFTLASTLLPTRTVFERLGLAVLFGELVFLALTLLRHIAGYPFTPPVWYAVGALIIAGLGVLFIRDTGGLTFRWFDRSDLVTVLLGIVVFAYGATVFSKNGYHPAPGGGEQYVMHGFLNGDTATLFALTWRAQETGRLNTENPFAGNGPLEYPTLLHGALGILLKTVGGDITRAAWVLMVPSLFGTLVVLTSLFRSLGPPDAPILWGLGGGAAVLFYGWDAFVYPQSHTFLTGLFLLFVLLLLAGEQPRFDLGRVQGRTLATAWVVALVLLFSNAVLGTAAVAVFSGVSLLRMFRERTLSTRLAWVIGAASLIVLFLAFPPGEGGLGRLNVPYTAFPTIAMVLLPVLLVFRGLRQETGWHRATLTSMAVVLPALTVVTLFFSRRDIVADNASRFLFLFLLATWPVAVGALRPLATSWLREARDRARGFQERLVLWGGIAASFLALALPAATTVAGTTDSLIVSRPTVVSPDELAAFSWIRSHTPPDAVFARAPERLFEDLSVAPLGLPAFTGRAQLRSDFWLSPDDESAAKVLEFFRGDREVLPPAQYVFCGPERTPCPDRHPAVFTAGKVRILTLTK